MSAPAEVSAPPAPRAPRHSLEVEVARASVLAALPLAIAHEARGPGTRRQRAERRRQRRRHHGSTARGGPPSRRARRRPRAPAPEQGPGAGGGASPERCPRGLRGAGLTVLSRLGGPWARAGLARLGGPGLKRGAGRGPPASRSPVLSPRPRGGLCRLPRSCAPATRRVRGSPLSSGLLPPSTPALARRIAHVVLRCTEVPNAEL